MKMKEERRAKPLVWRKFLRIHERVRRSANGESGVRVTFLTAGGCGALSVSLPMGSELDAPTELALLRGELRAANPNHRINDDGRYSATTVVASLQFSYMELPRNHQFRDQ